MNFVDLFSFEIFENQSFNDLSFDFDFHCYLIIFDNESTITYVNKSFISVLYTIIDQIESIDALRFYFFEMILLNIRIYESNHKAHN